MNDNNMPATEVEAGADRETAAYELAFHVLPTVAEGEVASVFTALKTHIMSHGGEVFDTEAPERFDLAYEIVKYLEGRNRRFGSAYFGWIRFRLDPRALAAVTEDVMGEKRLLRYLLIRLTKAEEQAPFRFHESVEKTKVITISDEVVLDEVAGEVVAEGEEEGDKVASGDDAVKSV
jgi:ribosomal protein S6